MIALFVGLTAIGVAMTFMQRKPRKNRRIRLPAPTAEATRGSIQTFKRIHGQP